MQGNESAPEYSGTDQNSIETNPSRPDNPSGRSLEELLNEVDAETLDQRRHARSTSDPRDMKRCPACGSVKLHQKTGGPCGTRKPGDYRCDGCNHHFDEPVVADETADVKTDGGETVRPVDDSPPHIPDAEIYSTHRPGEWIAITDAVYADVVTGSWHEDYWMSFVALPTGRLWVHITTAWERYEDTPPSDYAVTDGGQPAAFDDGDGDCIETQLDSAVAFEEVR